MKLRNDDGTPTLRAVLESVSTALHGTYEDLTVHETRLGDDGSVLVWGETAEGQTFSFTLKASTIQRTDY